MKRRVGSLQRGGGRGGWKVRKKNMCCWEKGAPFSAAAIQDNTPHPDFKAMSQMR